MFGLSTGRIGSPYCTFTLHRRVNVAPSTEFIFWGIFVRATVRLVFQNWQPEHQKMNCSVYRYIIFKLLHKANTQKKSRAALNPRRVASRRMVIVIKLRRVLSGPVSFCRTDEERCHRTAHK